MKMILNMFGLRKTNVPLTEDLNVIRKYYVYEWFIKETKEIFYVGKGTGERYKSKDRNYLFKEIEAKFEIDVRIVADNLSEHEALVLEENLIINYLKQGRVLINTITTTDEGLFERINYEYFKAPVIQSNKVYKHFFGIKDTNYDLIDPEKLKYSHIPTRSIHGLYTLYVKNQTEHMPNHYFMPIIEDAIDKITFGITNMGGLVYKSKSTNVKAIIEPTATTYESYAKLKNEGYDVYHLIDVMKYFHLKLDETKLVLPDKNRKFKEVKGKGKKIIDRHYYLLGEVRELKPKYNKGLINSEKLIQLLKEDVELHKEFVKYYAMESDDIVNYPAFKELAIIYEKEGNYQTAIDISKRALEEKVEEKSSFERRIKKLEKKLNTQ